MEKVSYIYKTKELSRFKKHTYITEITKGQPLCGLETFNVAALQYTFVGGYSSATKNKKAWQIVTLARNNFQSDINTMLRYYDAEIDCVAVKLYKDED